MSEPIAEPSRRAAKANARQYSPTIYGRSVLSALGRLIRFAQQ